MPIKNPKEIAFEEIIECEFKSIKEHLKDLHERYDQVCKKLVQMEPKNVTVSNGDFLAPSGCRVIKNGKVIDWSDEQMKDFASWSKTAENFHRSTNEAFEKYKDLIK